MTQAWFVYNRRGFPELYEVRIIAEKKRSPGEDIIKVKITDILWEAPKFKAAFSSESNYFFEKKDIFFTKEAAIKEHKRKLLKFILISECTIKGLRAALDNYEIAGTYQKYISPFTGEEK